MKSNNNLTFLISTIELLENNHPNTQKNVI